MKCVSALLCVSLISYAAAADWSYDRSDNVNGPGGWGQGQCTGSKNSPIDIEPDETERKIPVAWTTSGWDATQTWNVSNSGYSVKFNLHGDVETSGGGLEYIYDMVQFHLHWGATDDAGSEHTVAGKSYPMEIHFVHSKAKFNKDLGEALGSGEDDALAVLGFFFELQSNNNTDLDDMVAAVEDVQGQDRTSDLVQLPKLKDMLSSQTDGNWWRYDGGLTTPPCNEQVVWTVFQNPIKISAAQMEVFRQVYSGGHTELYRPVQALGDREVYQYQQGYTGSAASYSVSLAMMATLLITFL